MTGKQGSGKPTETPGKAPERKPDAALTAQDKADVARAWGKSVVASVKTWRDVVRVRVVDLGGRAV